MIPCYRVMELPEIGMQEEEWLWEKKMVSLFGNAEFEMPVSRA